MFQGFGDANWLRGEVLKEGNSIQNLFMSTLDN